ncbi:Hypothetical_protein [Hexamita inflata]|uniref:Hypothetical_protein n=1 Tax=Hexamita inflata TaxID=28002 RepID=A0AA86USM8_9EUKA|nr:Hypothetical protein HINF_LOCUS50836 [Hexamita inflata]
MSQFDYYQIEMNSQICSQFIFTNRFDIDQINYQIGYDNFTNNYVFGNEQNIKNAFINIESNTYNSQVAPLFNTQQYFNNIKIQISSQTLGTGQILSSKSNIIINQLNIISKTNNSIIIGASNILHIIQPFSNTTNITNLLVNLSVQQSQGSLGLIGFINCTLRITNYQILGFYQTTGCVSMVSLQTTNGAIQINSLNFLAQLFNVGNLSSYLLSTTNYSNITLTNIVVQIQANYSSESLNSIDGNNSHFFQFGGFVSLTNNTKIQLSQIIFNSQQFFSALYIKYSGFMVGFAKVTTANQIQIQDVCFNQQISSTSHFVRFGLFGFIEENLQITQFQIIILASGIFDYFGVIGETSEKCNMTYFDNLVISIDLIQQQGQCVSAFMGRQHSLNFSLSNCVIKNTNLNGSEFVGAVIGHSCHPVYITNSSVLNNNFSSLSWSGGFIGHSNSYYVAIVNCTSSNNTVNSTNFTGGLIGYAHTYYIVNQLVLLEVTNTTCFNNNLGSNEYSGGITGYINATAIITSCNVSNTTVISLNFAGGMAGFGNYSTITLKTIKIQSTKISKQNGALLIGYQTNSTVNLINSWSEGNNFVNNILVQNCAVFNSSVSINGC